MNTEQKAKAYDEALKTATQWFKDGCSDKEKICLECIFPELRESEDERIRERLLEYFHGFLKGYEDCYKDGGSVRWEGLDVKSIIAWLEKQKECVADSSKTSANEDERIREWLIDYFKEVGNSWIHRDISPKQILAYLEKQKEPEDVSASTMIPSCWEVEQKPAEWDDYTKTNLGRAIQIIKDARGTLHGYQTDDGIYECDKAIEALEHFLYRGLEIEKSAEWSEEDEEMIMNIISSLHGYICTFGPDPKNHEAHIQKEINWLKSLRPVSKESLQSHWKPSEYTLSLVKKVANGEILTHMEQMAMETLCNDLQKLL